MSILLDIIWCNDPKQLYQRLPCLRLSQHDPCFLHQAPSKFVQWRLNRPRCHFVCPPEMLPMSYRVTLISWHTTKPPFLTRHSCFTFIFLITSPGLLLWLKCFSRWGAPAPEGQCVYLPALQLRELLPAELPSASRSFPLAADSSTNSSVSHQSRCPGGKTAEASFSHPPSPLTSCSAAQSSGVRHRNLNLTVPLLQQGLTPPPSFLMSRAGRQHSRESKGIRGGSGERVLLQDKKSGNWCSGSRNSYEVHWAK